jgi:hypothetical protein
MKRMLRVLLIVVAAFAPRVASAQLAVAWNDFSRGTGLVRILRTRSPWEFRSPPIEVGRDATLHYRFGRLYAVSRTDATITVIARRGQRIIRAVELAQGSEPKTSRSSAGT